MMKRLFILIAALMFIWLICSSCAGEIIEEFPDDFESYTDPAPDSSGEDGVADMLPSERKAMISRLNALSGYQGDDILDDRELHFKYQPLEDGVSCRVMLYYGDRNDGCDVCVPEKLGGLTVTAIANSAFQGRDYLETVELPETVMLVDDMAFHQCSSLKSVKLNEGIVMLGKSCFGGCVSLEELELPESLEIVGEFAFLQCLKLHEIHFGENLKEIRANAFVLCDSLKKITIPRDADVDERAFTGIPEDTEIVFSE